VSLVSGETLKLQGQRGKPMLVNFWATWCAPCREEMPAMERLYIKHRERGFVLLAVSVDTDASVVKPFLERYKLTFPVALDAKMDLANAYGVRALPASFLIDRNGYLTALALGPRAWDNRAAHTLVEGMLAQ
jgi:peroxiredoxin